MTVRRHPDQGTTWRGLRDVRMGRGADVHGSTVRTLISKGWVEMRGVEARMTQAGRDALKAHEVALRARQALRRAA